MANARRPRLSLFKSWPAAAQFLALCVLTSCGNDLGDTQDPEERGFPLRAGLFSTEVTSIESDCDPHFERLVNETGFPGPLIIRADRHPDYPGVQQLRLIFDEIRADVGSSGGWHTGPELSLWALPGEVFLDESTGLLPNCDDQRRVRLVQTPQASTYDLIVDAEYSDAVGSCMRYREAMPRQACSEQYVIRLELVQECPGYCIGSAEDDRVSYDLLPSVYGETSYHVVQPDTFVCEPDPRVDPPLCPAEFMVESEPAE